MRHYEQIKSICDWLYSIDKNGSYTDVYEEWNGYMQEQKVNATTDLITILYLHAYHEEDEIWGRNFETAIKTLKEIRDELGGCKNV